MEQVIRKAIEGGYNPWPEVWGFTPFQNVGENRAYWNNPITHRKVSKEFFEIVLDTLFWQALGKACEKIGIEDQWKKTQCDCGGIDFHIAGHDAHHGDCARVKCPRGWLFHAKKFHEKNLTEGWDAACAYLQEITK